MRKDSGHAGQNLSALFHLLQNLSQRVTLAIQTHAGHLPPLSATTREGVRITVTLWLLDVTHSTKPTLHT